MTQPEEREEFQKWCLAAHAPHIVKAHFAICKESGAYWDRDVRNMFAGWQARASLPERGGLNEKSSAVD